MAFVTLNARPSARPAPTLRATDGRADLRRAGSDQPERVPGERPPPPRWWSNELGETRHTQSRHGWTAAEYAVVGVDFVNEVVTFVRQA
jgi:hypothetical protein